MKKKITTTMCIILLAVMVYLYFYPFVYQSDYYGDLGIGMAHTYDSVVEKLGEPLCVRQNADGGWNVEYDGFYLFYNHIETGAFMRVVVYGKQH